MQKEYDLINKKYRSCQSAITLLARSWRLINTSFSSIPEMTGLDNEQLLLIKVELDKMKKVFEAVIKLMEKE